MSYSILFEHTISETASRASVPVSAIPISKGRLKCWTDLAEFWDANKDCFADIFFYALSHIAKGYYPRKATPMRPLLALVEKAITTDTNALAAWRGDHNFRDAFTKVSKSITFDPDGRRRWKSVAIRRFVYCRLYCLTFYRDQPQPILTRKLIHQRRHYYALLKRIEIQTDHDLFAEAIKTLIPSAHEWTAEQWVSEKAIFAQFYAVHGADYSKDTEKFDNLISMIMNKLEGKPYYRQLFAIKDIPASIADAIWSQNLVKEICTQFNSVSRIKPFVRRRNIIIYNNITPELVTQSWAFQQLVAWRESSTYNLSASVRKNMLTFALGEYPRAE